MPSKGRPLTNPSKWEEGWELKMYKLGSKGASMQELAAMLRISTSTFGRLQKRDEHFADVVQTCKDRSEAWWLKNGRTNLNNKQFSYTGWYMNMKNRFGWTDRRDITSKDQALPTPILTQPEQVPNKNQVKKQIAQREKEMKEEEAKKQ